MADTGSTQEAIRRAVYPSVSDHGFLYVQTVQTNWAEYLAELGATGGPMFMPGRTGTSSAGVVKISGFRWNVGKGNSGKAFTVSSDIATTSKLGTAEC